MLFLFIMIEEQRVNQNYCKKDNINGFISYFYLRFFISLDVI